MSKVISLFSGSKGNAFYINCKNTSVLIDAGVSARALELAMEKYGISPENTDAVFVTHEHIDHARGLRVFADRWNIPVFASGGTLSALDTAGLLPSRAKINETGPDGVNVGDAFLTPFSVPHDCKEPTGFVCQTDDGKKISVCTDLGHITSEVKNAVTGSDFILLESNHDVDMLKNGSYPPMLKRRILGLFGHLSNDDCDEMLASLVENGTTRIMLGHISEENNSVALALSCARKALFSSGCAENTDYIIYAASSCGNGGFCAL